jgi:hypothetical protein
LGYEGSRVHEQSHAIATVDGTACDRRGRLDERHFLPRTIDEAPEFVQTIMEKFDPFLRRPVLAIDEREKSVFLEAVGIL